MTLFYTDVSNNNWNSAQEVTDFLSQLRGEGISGVVHKVSQGSDFADGYWQECRSWCEANNMSWLGYHYADTSDPATQVNAFIANNGGPNVMIDLEAGSGGAGDFWSLVNDFNQLGVNVSLAYIPKWYWENIGRPDLYLLGANQISLVSSNYPCTDNDIPSNLYDISGGDQGPGWDVYGRCAPMAWQFTQWANIAGLTVDCNAYKGTNLDDFFTSNIFRS